MPAEISTHLPSGPAPEAPDWRGTSRYEVLRCIGKGGMGVVYEAFDRERQQRVALKTILNSTPSALYLFKQEFRTLADVHHANLVRLYELVATDEGRVFFTMELVDGTDFLTHVQKGGQGPSEDPSERTYDEPTRRETWTEGSGDRLRRLRPVPKPASTNKNSLADIDRLRPALAQLVQGVCALHAAGKLHRDIKPSNVRVTPEGRVVLLDFGVATELSKVVDENLAEGGEMVGTARYMAPEQALNEGPTPASDWYSVGVMLYEALVGAPPFAGSAFDILKMKSMLDPKPPGDCVENVPADLDALATALLLRAPELRPTGSDILYQLGLRPSGSMPVPAQPAPETATAIVGREAPLRALREAFDSARTGRSITVQVGGPTGMGKSTVVTHFLDELVAHGEAVVLRGRAHERESVPYKGVDSVVDAMSRYLMRLSDREDSLTLPHDVWALARLFPVLRRVPSIARAEGGPAALAAREQFGGDPNRLRRRAFFAFRELVASLARRQPLVVYVDGVQWGDKDSAALLLELVRPPEAPPLLLILTYRDEDVQTSPFLLETRARWPALAELRSITIGPLAEAETRRLALTLLGADDARAQVTAEAIALEARGSPFLVDELARSVSGPHRVARSEDTSPGIATVTLEQMVKARLARLPDRELRLLRVVAVAGRPLPVSVAADAAGVRDAVDDAVGLVRARRFIRTGIRDGRETVEMSHDRIREMIVTKLSPRVIREHHRALARVLEGLPDGDPEAIAAHLLGAGEKERAALHAERAAERAAEHLAFDRAISLYKLTLESLPRTSAEQHRLRLRLAEVLEWAGRGAESARVYLEEARDAPASERVNLERAAAEQLLTSGRIDEGGIVLHRVLDSLGMRAPGSAASAVFWLLVYRVILFFMGLRVVEREPEEVRPEDRLRIDALYSVALGFVLVDVIVGACMQARHLIYALRKGDRFQVLRAVSLEASTLARAGGAESRRERRLHALGEGLANQSDFADGRIFVDGTRGIALFLRGQFKESRGFLEVASGHDTTHMRAGWQANAYLFALDLLMILGDVHEAAALRDRLLVEAEERGDLYTIVNIDSRATVLLSLVADEPETARVRLREAMAHWSQSGFFLQHWQAMQYEAEIELYVGAGGRAYDRMVADEVAIRRSMLLRVHILRTLAGFLRGRCAIASLGSLPEAGRARRLAEAGRISRRLRRGRDWERGLGLMLAACVANASNRRPRTVALLREAIAATEKHNMLLHAMAARYRLGQLLGNESGPGKRMGQEAADEMALRGVRSPQRMAARLMPGRWGES